MIITENCRPGSVPIRSLWNLMPGTGGVRKKRWGGGRRGKGRRGGLRIIYCYFPSDPQIWLMTLYDKSEAADLTAKDNESFESRDGKRTEGAGSQTGERGPSATEDILMAKRDVFSELTHGLGSSEAHREGKITLRSYKVEVVPLPKVDSKLIRDTRKRLRSSRAVLAPKLRITERTLEKWEQGRAKPNP